MKVKVRRELIKQLRTKQAWTQEQLAEFSGLHSRTVQRIENEGMASLQSLRSVARAFEVDVDSLELTAEKIEFGPLLAESRILLLAIGRKLLPTHDSPLPNSFILVMLVLAFAASFTFINVVLLIAGQPEENLGHPVLLAMFGLALLFSAAFLFLVFPLAGLKTWARAGMLGICWVFFAINSLLFIQALANINGDGGLPLLEYLYNLVVTFWIYRALTKADVRLLFQSSESPMPPESLDSTETLQGNRQPHT